MSDFEKIQILLNIVQHIQNMIKSSFKKIQKKGTDTNTAHFGHPELDAVLNNNLKKGHLIIIQQDHPTTIYASLLRYFVASNFHKSLYSLVFDSLIPEKWSSIVPQEIKEKTSQKIQKNNQPQKSEIAWRYDSMKINLNTLIVSENIPFMDLSKNVAPEKAKKLVKTYGYNGMQLKQLYNKIQQELMNTLNDSNDTALRKLVLTGFPEEYFGSKDFQVFLHSIRCLARTSHILIVLTVGPVSGDRDLLDSLVSYSDYYLKINSELGEAYSHFDGTLALIKEVQVGSVDVNERGITVWGVKAKSKKQIRIEPLYENTVEDQGHKQQHPCGVTAKESLQF